MKAWFEIARAESEKDNLPLEHGKGLADRERRAAAHGITGASLRNYLDAYRFVARIRLADSASAAALSDLPATAVAIYARWSKYDRKAALAHAVQAFQQGFSVADVVQAEKRARQQQVPETQSLMQRLLNNLREKDRDDRVSTATEIRHAFGRHELSTPVLRYLDLSPVDELWPQSLGFKEVLTVTFEEDGTSNRPSLLRSVWFDRRSMPTTGRIGLVGILELEPGSTGDMHRRMAKVTYARALAALSYFPLVVILTADRITLEEVLQMLPTPPLEKLGTGSEIRGNCFSPSRESGTVMITDVVALGQNWD